MMTLTDKTMKSALTVTALSLLALGACKPDSKKSSSPSTPPVSGLSIAPVGVSGTEIQVAGSSFPARIAFAINGTTDPTQVALAMVERPANSTIEGRTSLNPSLLWTPTTSQPQAYVQFVLRDLKRCTETTGNPASCSLIDGQISPSSPVQPYDTLSTRYTLRFTGSTSVLQNNGTAVVPGSTTTPIPNNGSTIGGVVWDQVTNQFINAGGNVLSQYIANGFSTEGLSWQDILRQAFGVPSTSTTNPAPVPPTTE